MKPPVEVAKPCTADWDAMTGDDRKRLCAQCDKHVHNLSALTRGELKHLVDRRDGTECIGYEVRADGSMVTAPRFKWFTRMFVPMRWVLGLILPFLFANCARRTGGKPAPASPVHSKQARVTPDNRIVMGEAPTVSANDESKPSSDRMIVRGKPLPKPK